MAEQIKTLEEQRITKIEEKVDKSVNSSKDCKSCDNGKHVEMHERELIAVKKRLDKVEGSTAILTKVDTKLDIFTDTMRQVALKVDSIADETSKQGAKIDNNAKYVGNVNRNLKDHERNFHHNKN